MTPAEFAAAHPLIMRAFLAPPPRKRKPRPTHAHKSKSAPTGRLNPRPPLLIDVTQPDRMPVEWFRATSMVNVRKETMNVSAVGLGPECAVNQLLTKLWRRGLRFSSVTITRAGRNPALYADFAEIALIGIPTPGSSYRSHALRRTSHMSPPPGSECPVDRFGHQGPPERPCDRCGKHFELRSPWHKFCSNLCRLHHFRAGARICTRPDNPTTDQQLSNRPPTTPPNAGYNGG